MKEMIFDNLIGHEDLFYVLDWVNSVEHLCISKMFSLSVARMSIDLNVIGITSDQQELKSNKRHHFQIVSCQNTNLRFDNGLHVFAPKTHTHDTHIPDRQFRIYLLFFHLFISRVIIAWFSSNERVYADVSSSPVVAMIFVRSLHFILIIILFASNVICDLTVAVPHRTKKRKKKCWLNGDIKQ